VVLNHVSGVIVAAAVVVLVAIAVVVTSSGRHTMAQLAAGGIRQLAHKGIMSAVD